MTTTTSNGDNKQTHADDAHASSDGPAAGAEHVVMQPPPTTPTTTTPMRADDDDAGRADGPRASPPRQPGWPRPCCCWCCVLLALTLTLPKCVLLCGVSVVFSQFYRFLARFSGESKSKISTFCLGVRDECQAFWRRNFAPAGD